MGRRLRPAFWLEIIAATVSGVFLVLAILWRDWIEIVFHVDPDRGNGAVEGLIVLASRLSLSCSVSSLEPNGVGPGQRRSPRHWTSDNLPVATPDRWARSLSDAPRQSLAVGVGWSVGAALSTCS
jgi:hypothetical protein